MAKFIVTLLFVLCSQASFGCICWFEGFPAGYLDQNKLGEIPEYYILHAKIIDINIGDNVCQKDPGRHGNLVNVLVYKSWPPTRNVSDTLTLFNDDYCAYPFVTDSTYLIGARTFDRYLYTSQCEGTQLYSKLEDSLNILGPGKPPVSDNSYWTDIRQHSPPPKSYSDGSSIILILSVLVNVVLILGFLIKKESCEM